MDFSQFTALTVAWVAIIITPGPDFFLTLRSGTISRLHGLKTAAGIVLGVLLWLAAAIAGLGAIAKAFPWAITIISVLGGFYLIWLGWQAIRSALAARRPAEDGKEDVKDYLNSHPFRSGLLTNLTNPKAVIFFGAILSNFLPTNLSVLSMSAMVVYLISMEVIWFGAVALLISTPKVQRWVNRYRSVMDGGTGIIMLVLATVLLGKGVAEVF